ncbi:26626_t:CDS:2 [Gigaspora margarita]|uniref:26626_t:CDS:1 n=1 Tax=Gigaspora margarita TaxID=4874 RepID=A0ABN7UVB0_GIGMA|nr:26626_t:CDS:2 [Gigaspora margarita]
MNEKTSDHFAASPRNFDQQRYTERSIKNISDKKDNKTRYEKKLEYLDLENKELQQIS